MSHLRRSFQRAAAVTAAAATCLGAPAAVADESWPGLRVDWGRLAETLRSGTGAILPREPEPTELPAGAETKWLSVVPSISVVARDWGRSELLVGQLAVTDQFRLTRSTRMVLTRVRLADGRFAPFVHLGVGEWRVDRTLLPTLPQAQDLAGQVGAGFELAVARHATLALETAGTLLYLDDDASRSITSAALWSSTLAARALF
jgi:hypothetical protein